MTDREKAIIIFALNAFGDGGPMATVETLEFFTREHIINCLREAELCEGVSETGRELARAALEKV